MQRTASLETRFWSKVDKRGPDECWPWTGTYVSLARRYGLMRVSGRCVRATRISWSIAHAEPFPVGKIACHTCDNPTCVNPSHIWAGTPRDNSQDMIRKGRAHHQKHLRVTPEGKVALGPRTHCYMGHAYADQRPYPSDKFRRCRTCHYQRTYAASALRRAAKSS